MSQFDDEKLQAIVSVLRAIPPGTLCSYGEVARRAGLPGHARYVATILKRHAVAAKLPWHRIVTAQYHIAFSPEDPRYTEQRRLLEQEGCRVNGKRVHATSASQK